MEVNKKEIILSCPIFSCLEERYAVKLAQTGLIKKYEDSQIVFSQGVRADGFYLVAKGEIEVFFLGENGREQTLHIFSEGDLCGEVPMFEGGCYPASARARSETEALYIPGDQFLTIAYEDPEILMEMLAELSKRLRKFVGMVADLSLKDVTTRLIKYLLELPEKDGSVCLDCSKTELASRLGTIPETVSRSIAKLKKQGLIVTENNRNFVINRDELREI